MNASHLLVTPIVSTAPRKAVNSLFNCHGARVSHKRPAVYFAGKIYKNCWRHRLIPDLRERGYSDGPIDLPLFKYVGPFFVSCDHGCYHETGGHGAETGCSEDLDNSRSAVFDRCEAAIRVSDLVFAYITTPDCHGTLVEIGMAHILEIPVAVAFEAGPSSTIARDLWFGTVRAESIFFDVTEEHLADLFYLYLQGNIP